MTLFVNIDNKHFCFGDVSKIPLSSVTIVMTEYNIPLLIFFTSSRFLMVLHPLVCGLRQSGGGPVIKVEVFGQSAASRSYQAF